MLLVVRRDEVDLVRGSDGVPTGSIAGTADSSNSSPSPSADISTNRCARKTAAGRRKVAQLLVGFWGW